jgi:Protein of unknown function (DUF2917)
MSASIFKSAECRETPVMLEKNQFTSIKRAQGVCLQCVRGSVWITLANDPLDLVLSAGERVCINVPGRMVIEGLEASEIILAQPEFHAGLRDQLRNFAAHVSGALQRVTMSRQYLPLHAKDQFTTSYGNFRS